MSIKLHEYFCISYKFVSIPKVIILLQEIREKLERDPQIFHKSEENIKENQKASSWAGKFFLVIHDKHTVHYQIKILSFFIHSTMVR